MADHYYTRKPTIASEPIYWSYQLKGSTFNFKTDRGVFSKGEVDYGSRLLISFFELPEIEGPILDVGCGYGPIGLALARSFPNRSVHMIDINERALQLAKENAENNRIKNINIYESDGYEGVTENNFAAIVTNPPIRAGKKVVMDIIANSVNHLRDSGELWVVIQKKQGAPSVKKRLEEIYSVVDVVKRDKGYYIIRAKKV
ncbi:class I SAM-dependent methyltransferase [Bacillus andreraoultii]|uniref:class I SAM-dependent methyltransferase n=1 Tax=Bacillus andreraoultii TaxID=1499685 RepID=UPI00053A532E|nr:class I SAM-dependent methyltransferase [Bacillus andreraoultii]